MPRTAPTILHISDLHISDRQLSQGKVTLAEVQLLLRAFFRDLDEHLAQGIRPDIICFTGDLAFSGQAAEYDLAREHLILPLLEKLALPRDRLCWVPGNHDILQAIVQQDDLIEAGARGRLTNRAAVNEHLDDPTKRAQLFRRLTPYADFTRDFFGDILAGQEPAYFTTRLVALNDITIGIACLNSAWRSAGAGDAERGHLLIGDRQRHEALAGLANANLRIALVHHPPDWLEQDEMHIAEEFFSDAFDYVLTGHLHEPWVRQLRTPRGRAAFLPTGSLFQGRGLEGYSIIVLGPSPSVRLRRYFDRRERFDKDVTSAADGVFSLDPEANVGQTKLLAVDTTFLQEPKGRLPSHLTTFIGRREEIDEALQRLQGARLLTVVGPPGIGKSRLAVEIGRRVQPEFRDGVWTAELTDRAQADDVAQTVAATLRIREEPGQTLLDTLCGALRAQQALLILDNCEHLIDDCARVVERLLRECPALKVLATSQEPLAILGEVSQRVRPLSFPAPGEAVIVDSLRQFDAIELFRDRADRLGNGFVLTEQNAHNVAQICERLDGIPLAIELAASRLDVLTVDQVITKLENRFQLLGTVGRKVDRHSTLRATVDWSYNLATEEGRHLFNRLSVFAGGWQLEAAVSVASATDMPANQVELVLRRLINKSLVVSSPETHGERRFHLLGTLRQYAQERLAEVGETESVREKHALYYANFVERTHPELRGAQQKQWLDRLDQEQDNVRLALDWLRDQAKIDEALQTAGLLGRFWHMRGYWREGEQRLIELLGLSASAAPNSARARALVALGHLAFVQGDYDRARPPYEESLAIRRGLGNDADIADSLHRVGILAEVRGEYALATELQTESLALLRRLDNRALTADVLHHLGVLAALTGDDDLAETFYEESLSIRRYLGDRWGVAWSLVVGGNMHRAHGDYDRAQAQYQESLEIYRDLPDRRRLAYVLNKLGLVFLDQEDFERARQVFSESLSIGRELGIRGTVAESLGNLGRVSQAQGDLTAARALQAESLALAREMGQQEAAAGHGYALENAWPGYYDVGGSRARVADALTSLAVIAMEQRDDTAARTYLDESLRLVEELDDGRRVAEALEATTRLAAANRQFVRTLSLAASASAMRRRLRAPLSPAGQFENNRRLAAAREVLGGEAEAVWQGGEAMSLREALDSARETVLSAAKEALR